MDQMKVKDSVPENDNMGKIRFMLKPENLKLTCQMLEAMLDERKSHLYNNTNNVINANVNNNTNTNSNSNNNAS